MFNGLDGGCTSPASDGPQFEVVDVAEVDGPDVVVRVVGDLDLTTAPRLAAHLQRRTGSSPSGSTVVVDLSGCGFLGSKGVAVLMSAAQDAADRGRDFKIVGCRPIVLRVLDITGVRGALDVTPA